VNANKPSVVLDPSYLEEQLSTGTITLALNPQKDICVINKSGGVPLSIDEIMNVVKVGSQKVKDVDQLIKRLITKRGTGVDLTAVQDR
jgi:exosome complex component RRP45